MKFANFSPPVPNHFNDMDFNVSVKVTNLFKQLEGAYPKLARLQSIGRSVKNRELWVLEINGNVHNRSLLTPMFKYVANMHGDESIGRQLVIYLAQYLLQNYGKVERVTRLVDSVDIHLMPSMNPDGYENSLVSCGAGFCCGGGKLSVNNVVAGGKLRVEERLRGTGERESCRSQSGFSRSV